MNAEYITSLIRGKRWNITHNSYVGKVMVTWEGHMILKTLTVVGDYILYQTRKRSLHFILKLSRDRFSQFSSIFLLRTDSRVVKMFFPTVYRVGKHTSKWVCLDVSIWEYCSSIHSMVGVRNWYSLKSIKACLYTIIWSGSALLFILCSFSNDMNLW